MAENAAPPSAGLGMHVELELIDAAGLAEPLAVDIVPAASADLTAGLLAANTPLAKAIRGKTAGEVVPYQLGDVTRVRILRVTPSEGQVSSEAAERRDAVLKKALASAERTNAEMFAASFSGKWGDYNLDDAEEWDT